VPSTIHLQVLRIVDFLISDISFDRFQFGSSDYFVVFLGNDGVRVLGMVPPIALLGGVVFIPVDLVQRLSFLDAKSIRLLGLIDVEKTSISGFLIDWFQRDHVLGFRPCHRVSLFLVGEELRVDRLCLPIIHDLSLHNLRTDRFSLSN